MKGAMHGDQRAANARLRAPGLILAGIAAGGLAGLLAWRSRQSGGDNRSRTTYPPLDVPKPIADGIWIVDSGPMTAMGLSLPIRMTIVRLPNGDLLLHSPTPFSADLAKTVEAIGPVRHLVAPNIAHWTFLSAWQRAYPDATTWGAPGLRDRAQVRASNVRIDVDLGDAPPDVWSDTIDQGVVTGGAGFAEVWFFHRPTRTLLLVDLIENLEPEKLPLVERLLMQAAAATRGTTARYLRLPVRLGGKDARQAIRSIVDLKPDRVIFAHGRTFDRDGAARLRHGFAWMF